MVVHCISMDKQQSIQSSFDAHSGIAVQLVTMEDQSMHITSHQFRSSTQHSQIVHLHMVEVFMQIQSQHVFHSEHVCLKIVKLFIVEVEFALIFVQQEVDIV